ncbi:AraC family transcriptional regulator [Actinomadura pelletieri DSM 43383]|uniref:AraC family transcriptional regulator n=1 Tax=Actinomadura pelletieri DSM 43383 TaxID=1120940 RepID=A0A495QMI9_9ACTN|nr:AraC family transcriptional regulator [Actinomadura pelletieri]RKS73651.1 AraC family transcriptional regulator [Actinomadura pelletieri DSM 43383]
MDALTDLLDGPRARGAFMIRSTLAPPWAIRIQDEAPLTLLSMVRDDAWLLPDGGEPERVSPGDMVIFRGPDPYTVADDPATEPQIVIHPGQRCTTPDGTSLSEAMDLGVRAWGDDPDGSTVMLIGAYQMRGAVTRRLLSALPPIAIVRGDTFKSPLVDVLGEEIGKDEPGQDVVLDRLLDLLLIATLRAWFSRPDAGAPGWYRAHGDAVVGPALRLLHDDLAHPWTVADLASAVGVSRAALAQRFTKLIGEPPMAYLTGIRLAQAADLLRESDATLETVARRVGYGNGFALSTAFKREHGVSPQEYRAGPTG